MIPGPRIFMPKIGTVAGKILDVAARVPSTAQKLTSKIINLRKNTQKLFEAPHENILAGKEQHKTLIDLWGEGKNINLIFEEGSKFLSKISERDLPIQTSASKHKTELESLCNAMDTNGAKGGQLEKPIVNMFNSTTVKHAQKIVEKPEQHNLITEFKGKTYKGCIDALDHGKYDVVSVPQGLSGSEKHEIIKFADRKGTSTFVNIEVDAKTEQQAVETLKAQTIQQVIPKEAEEIIQRLNDEKNKSFHGGQKSIDKLIAQQQTQKEIDEILKNNNQSVVDKFLNSQEKPETAEQIAARVGQKPDIFAQALKAIKNKTP